MKVTIIGQEPIYIDEEQAERLKAAIGQGKEWLLIEGNLYKTSSITAITDGEPAGFRTLIGQSPRLSAPNSDRADGTGPGYQKYQNMRRKLGLLSDQA